MKKKFFIVVFFVFITFIISNKSNAYSSDPEQFISEIVDEQKKYLLIQIAKNLKQRNYRK